ncbi:MAG: Alginate lyase protein, partial [Bacteroidota bacterium]|nr:Alginate lyase protein [Bacteroidota bacterium]
MSGPAWDAVQAAADIDFSEPVIADNNSNDDVNCLAAAIVYARTGNELYKDKVIDALEYNIARGNPGFDSNGILTWCRNT